MVPPSRSSSGQDGDGSLSGIDENNSLTRSFETEMLYYPTHVFKVFHDVLINLFIPERKTNR